MMPEKRIPEVVGRKAMSEAAVTAIAPWFGAKRNLAAQIVAEFGKHQSFWDVFCGSMSILLAKEPCSMETVNDLHGDLVNLGRTIQHATAGPALYRRLRRTWLSQELFDESAAVVKAQSFEPTPERAYHYFVASWFGRNGVAGTSNYRAAFCVRYTKNGGHAAKRFESVVNSIPAWRRRMRTITILSEDGLQLLDRIEDAPGTVIYCDPPYVVKGTKYVHDFETNDHRRLAGLLARFRQTRVVVSYYKHPLVDELYRGWTKRALDATKAMVNQSMRDKSGVVTKAPEVLFINGPSLVANAQAKLF